MGGSGSGPGPGDADLVEQVLAHHGVKGMRWGVRHLPSGGTVGTPIAGTPDARQAAAAKQKIAVGGTNALSTKELQSLVTRMNLEQQYSRLVASQPTALTRGHDQVRQILSLANTATQVFNLANSAAAKAGFALVKSAIAKG